MSSDASKSATAASSSSLRVFLRSTDTAATCSASSSTAPGVKRGSSNSPLALAQQAVCTTDHRARERRRGGRFGRTSGICHRRISGSLRRRRRGGSSSSLRRRRHRLSSSRRRGRFGKGRRKTGCPQVERERRRIHVEAPLRLRNFSFSRWSWRRRAGICLHLGLP